MLEVLPVRTVDAVIRDRCDARREGLVGRRRRRVDSAERALRACFERYGEPVLTAEERQLLALERLFGEPDPLARVAAGDAVLLVVPAFLLDAEWHGADLTDRRLRSVIAWRLAHRIAHHPEFTGLDLSVALGAVDDAERVARREMRRELPDEARRPSGERNGTPVLRPLDAPPTSPERSAPRRPFPARRS